MPTSHDTLPTEPQDDSPISIFRGVLQSEAAAILSAAQRLGPEIEEAVALLQQIEGRIIFTGLGKTGYVARKSAATFCSTGAPAIFLHPSEALHGDLGIVTHNDVLIALSNSGETEEILALLPFMVRMEVPVIAVTGSTDSALARRSSIVIDASVAREADEISVAPTNSTTVALAMCDALAVTLMSRRNFTREQFAIFHPGGKLGRKLLLEVSDLMRVGQSVPSVLSSDNLECALNVISDKRMGAVFVVSNTGQIQGILTDGDLRRLYHDPSRSDPMGSLSPASLKLTDLMTRSPQTIPPTALAAEALKRMEDHEITVLPVVEENDKLVGAIHLHDLIRAGLA